MTSNAFEQFRSKARRLQPTKAHRAAVWENMLGTIYAANPVGEVRYFDYDYAAAIAFVGKVTDVRVARFHPYKTPARCHFDDATWQHPRYRQLVWFAVDVKQ